MADITRKTFLDRQAAPPVDAPFLNDLQDAVYTAQRKPSLVLARTSAFTHGSTGVWLSVPFEQVPSAVLNIPAGAPAMDWTNRPSRLVIPVRGVYLVTAAIAFNLFATGFRALGVWKNATQAEGAALAGGNAIIQHFQPFNNSLDNTFLTAATVAVLAAGDWLQLFGYQTAGGALGIITGSGTPLLSAVRLASDVA